MKKFTFTLERMLAFKRTLYEKERNELIRLRAERAALEQRRDDTIRQTLARDAEFRHKAAEEGVGIDEVNALNYHRTNAEKLVKQLEAEMAALDVKIEEQLQVVIALDQDVKGLEKLREKQWAEYQAEAMKAEQERISEMVSTKFIEDRAAADLQEQQAAGYA